MSTEAGPPGIESKRKTGSIALVIALVVLLVIVIYEATRLSAAAAHARRADLKADQVAEQLKTAEKKMTELEGKLDAAQKYFAAAKNKLNAELASLNQEKRKAEKQTAETSKQLNADKQALTEKGRAHLERITALTRERDDLKATAETLARERDDLKKSADALIETRDQLKAQKKTLGRDLSETRRKLDRIGARRLAWRGTILLETGKPAEAESEFKAALAADPTHADAHKGLALSLESLGKTEDARKSWLAFVRTGPEEKDLKLAREHIKKLEE